MFQILESKACFPITDYAPFALPIPDSFFDNMLDEINESVEEKQRLLKESITLYVSLHRITFLCFFLHLEYQLSAICMNKIYFLL